MNVYRSLTTTEKKTFFAALGGWSLDALDFMIYTFVIATLIGLWGISKEQAGALSTVTLLFSAVGGWIAGILADKYGRVRILQITVGWFAVATIVIGFAQNFEQMFILRALQGIGFGGEWAVGSVLMGEVVRAEHRGRLVGFVQSGWALGWGVAAILYTIAFSFLPEDMAWRVLFWSSAVPAVAVVFIRRHVPEPAVFVKAKRSDGQKGPSFWAIFSKPFFATTALASILCAGIQGGNYAVTTWLPTYLKLERGLSVLGTGTYLFVIIAGSFFGFIAGAWLSDRLGRRRAIVIFVLLAFGSLFFYVHVRLSNIQTLVLGFPLGFCTVGCFGGIGAYLTELFPSQYRANGQGFAYNFGRAVGALFPALVGVLAERWGLGSAIVIFAGGAYVAAVAVIFLLPETQGVDLAQIDTHWSKRVEEAETRRASDVRQV